MYIYLCSKDTGALTFENFFGRVLVQPLQFVHVLFPSVNKYTGALNFEYFFLYISSTGTCSDSRCGSCTSSFRLSSRTVPLTYSRSVN